MKPLRLSQSCRELNPQLSAKVHPLDAIVVNLAPKKGKIEANHPRQIPHSKSQHNQTPALDGADEGETKGLDRVVVRFTGYRVRPLDPDNFAGSVKDLLDGLRHASIIEGDEWFRITLETRQEKVRTYAEEKTLIEIET